MDNSSAYDLVNHSILKSKLRQIGIKFSSVDMIIDYLTDRSIYTEINTNTSTINKSKNIGVCQGSTLSGLLYLIFTLDICSTNHSKKHENNISEKNCSKPKSSAYVDDIYGIIIANEDQIWKESLKYINNLNKYFKNNKLINNITKTKIMIISRNNFFYKNSITVEKKEITHSPTIKILGTILNEEMTWSNHIISSQNSLISQLKRRKNAIKVASKFVSPKFIINYANSILLSKINYHIEIWGKCSKTQYNLINNIIINTARQITNNKYGRTDEFILKSIKWLNLQETYKMAISKITHKFLQPTTNCHFLAAELRKNRSLRMKSQNKTGQKPMVRRDDRWTQKTFIFNSIDIYNKIPKEITLLKNKKNI